MGQLVFIKSINLDEGHLETLNKELETLGIENSFTTRKHNEDWVNDINTNPDSPQKHLKPKDRDLRVDELIRLFSTWCEIGSLSFDVAFSRTSQEEVNKYVEFIMGHKDELTLKGFDSLIDRFTLTLKECDVINEINVEEEPPKELPKDQQYIPDLQGGLFLCNSWGLKPFWVIFGKVKSPRFLKTKIYKDDLYNNLYKDKNGYTYLMLPLMPMDNSADNFIHDVFENAWNMGMREHPNVVLPIVYHLQFDPTMEYPDILLIAKDLIKTYGDKLVDKYVQVHNHFKYLIPSNDKVYWSEQDQKYRMYGSVPHVIACLNVVNCLIAAMKLSGNGDKILPL